MRVLNGPALEAAADETGLVDEMERAFRIHALGGFTMPDRAHVDLGAGTLLLMPCEASGHLGTKVVTVAPANRRKGLPVVQAVMLLLRADTGEPLAVMDGRVLTALRTAAASAVAIRHLAPPGAARVGIVGAGVQGRYHARFAAAVRPVEEIVVYDHRPGNLPPFAAHLADRLPGVRVRAARDVEELLEVCPVVVTATTSATPVLPDREEALAGRCFVAVGSFRPGMRELPGALLRRANRVFVDTEHAVEESGDLAVPLREGWISRDRVTTLGRALERGLPAPPPGPTTLYKSVGMALFDVLAAACLLDRSKALGVGADVAW